MRLELDRVEQALELVSPAHNWLNRARSLEDFHFHAGVNRRVVAWDPTHDDILDWVEDAAGGASARMRFLGYGGFTIDPTTTGIRYGDRRNFFTTDWLELQDAETGVQIRLERWNPPASSHGTRLLLFVQGPEPSGVDDVQAELERLLANKLRLCAGISDLDLTGFPLTVADAASFSGFSEGLLAGETS